MNNMAPTEGIRKKQTKKCHKRYSKIKEKRKNTVHNQYTPISKFDFH